MTRKAGADPAVDVAEEPAGFLCCRNCRRMHGHHFRTVLVGNMLKHLGDHLLARDDVPADLVTKILTDNPDGIVDPARNEHGGFSTCPVVDCGLCWVAATESEIHWEAGMTALGITLVQVDPSTWTPEETAEHDRRCKDAEMAAEMRAATDPDDERDYGKDIDDD